MSRRDHPRATRRMDADPRNMLFMRRFEKFMHWFSNREREESNAVVFDGENYICTGGRGLLHKGRKP